MRLLFVAMLAGCAFEHGQAQSGDDVPAPDAPVIPTARTCRFPDPSLRLCLELDDGSLSPTLHDSSANRLDPAASGLTPIMRDGTDPAATTAAAAVIKLGETPVLDINGAITIEMWVNPDKYSASVLLMNTDQYVMGLSPYGQVGCAMADHQVFSYSKQLPLHAWSHVACTFDGAKLRVYINGTSTDGISVSESIQTDGHDGTQIVSSFVGGIDGIRIYAADLGAQLCLHAGRTGC